MGRHVFAVGGNAEASRFSGLRLGRIQIGVFVISGLTAGIAAFLGASFYGSASCGDATGYELYVIASAVVGGASLSGGKGSAVSAMLGALLIVLIRQSIRTLHFDQNYEWIIIGCAIIVAVVLDQANARLTARRLARGGAARSADRHAQTRERHRHEQIRIDAPRPSLGAWSWRRAPPAAARQPSSQRGRQAPGAARGQGIKIAMIAKSSTNPVFLSARTGAEAAAKELSQKHDVPIEIVWLTPPTEDGQVQAQRIAQAVNEGANAMLISCSDAGKVTGAINDAVARGVPVMTFDSDAPESKRFAFYGVDDVKTGQAVMDELATQMGGKGKIAILAGNQNAPNLRKRVDGVKQEAAKYPGIKIVEHLLPHRDAAGRRRRGDPRAERLSGDPGLGDDRRLAAVHADAADRPRSRRR